MVSHLAKIWWCLALQSYCGVWPRIAIVVNYFSMLYWCIVSQSYCYVLPRKCVSSKSYSGVWPHTTVFIMYKMATPQAPPTPPPESEAVAKRCSYEVPCPTKLYWCQDSQTDSSG